MKTLVPVSAFSDVSVPQDGVDFESAASLEPGFQGLANRDAWLVDLVAGTGAGIARIVEAADLTELKAIVPLDGDVRRIAAAIYVFKAGDATTADDVLVVADDGATGRWLHVSQPVAGVANGLARLTEDATIGIESPDRTAPAVEGTGGPGSVLGNEGVGVKGTGAGAGAGVMGTGGSGAGGGLGVGAGLYGVGGGAGSPGAIGIATEDGNGVEGMGEGTGHGVVGVAGATGTGVVGNGGTTSGAGVKGTATAGNSNGVEGTGHGTGAGVKGTGAIGVEGVVDSGSTNGDGVKGTGKGTGVGVRGVGAAGGVGVKGEGVDDGSIGVEGVGGGTSVGTGVKGTGKSAGAGVWGVGGSSGVGGQFAANAQRGAINIAYAGEPTGGELGDMVFDTNAGKLKVCTSASPSVTWTAVH